MKCPRCKKTDLQVELVFTGGCSGHEPGERCYCSYPDAHVVLRCPSNRLRCRNLILPIPGLTDKAAIERWISARLEEPKKEARAEAP